MEDETINDKNCKQENEVKNQVIRGVVISKYLDDRKIRHFKYINDDSYDTIDSDILGGEGRHFFEYLNMGDSIRKNIGSLEFKVRRFSTDTLHVLSFDCIEL